ncbi:Dps family protein [Candidatus Nitrosotenuis cloacae]|uniref:Dps family ferritin n=1 Tax=Candidatus Nitrosotenuis cloacae TaxID=1603555 RepID=A0A3G1B3I0_9ARCH|nr:DNA starvation/stationary phase protection protein [Candidatus Nitrosotenuis cloacae]AJZ76210.1 Dps family ferritin [Candidatus Nitrosotenuis cloacae]
MNNIKIGISDKNRQIVIDLLGKLLADEYVLYTKTRNYHWNVVGSHFNDLHKFFESQYEEIDSDIDEIAERIRSLGEKTNSTLAEFVKNARIKEHPGEFPSADKMISNLVADHENLIQILRADVITCEENNDAGTADFLTGLMEKHEKTAWMLRSVLEK